MVLFAHSKVCTCIMYVYMYLCAHMYCLENDILIVHRGFAQSVCTCICVHVCLVNVSVVHMYYLENDSLIIRHGFTQSLYL